MSLPYIERSNLLEILDALSAEYDVLAPRRQDKEIYFEKFNPKNAPHYVFGEYRASQPPKSFFSRAKENVASYFTKTLTAQGKPKAIVGLKGCDLRSFKVQDFVFGDPALEDPTYARNRKNALIISADCTSFKEVCYCMHLGDLPYPGPKEGFDLNLSEVRGGFIVEAGSQKGEGLLDRFRAYFRDAGQDEIIARDNLRQDVTNKLRLSVANMGMPAQDGWQGLVARGFNSAVWEKWANFCVECGACTQSCPTCHCFLLYDWPGKSGFIRNRVWDSCQFYAFAKVAAGANPRPRLMQRLRNRYDKKFVFFKDVLGSYACTGCGRCIEACLGHIDMREIFKDLAKI